MPLQYQPFADGRLNTLHADLRMNVPDSERTASALTGGALLLAALARRGSARWLLLAGGAALVWRGLTGECPWYRRRGLDRRHDARGVRGDRGVKAEHTLEIHRSPEVLYAFWRDLERLPEIMRHVESVRRLSDRRSHWKVKAPLGQTAEWDAEIINDVPNELIAWQTLAGAAVRSAGSVRFERLESGSTRLTVNLQFDPPAGAAGAAIARFLGDSPQHCLAVDLTAFKSFAERELDPFPTHAR